MPESFTSPLDDRCSALEGFVGTTQLGTQHAPQWTGLRGSIRNGYGRSIIADGHRLRAALYTPKPHQVVHPPSPQSPTISRITKPRGKRARARSEGSRSAKLPQRRSPMPRKGSSKYYGVRYRPDLRKYVAEIRVREWKEADKKVWLGTFDTEEGAARGVDLARKLLKCRKKRPVNLPCPELDLYSTEIPPHLDLTDIANDAMFKEVVQFIKSEAQAYAAGLPPCTTTTTTPPVVLVVDAHAHSSPHQPGQYYYSPTNLPYDEGDILWTDDDYEVLGLSASELTVPDHHNAPNDNTIDHQDLIPTDHIDMDAIFDEDAFAFQYSHSPELDHQFESEIACEASPEQEWEMEMQVEAVQPVRQNLAAEASLPPTWPGYASPSSGASFPLDSGFRSELSLLYGSHGGEGGHETFFTNNWALQSDQYQFRNGHEQTLPNLGYLF